MSPECLAFREAALPYPVSADLFFVLQDPFKSTLVLGALIAVWLVLSLVSTRMIIMAAGLVRISAKRCLRSTRKSSTLTLFSQGSIRSYI